MQNNVCADIFWYGEMLLHVLPQKKREYVQNFICTKYMENCEAMTSSTHSFAFSYRLFKKFFIANYENSKFHIFLILLSHLHQIFTFLFKMFYSFYWINLNLDQISPLTAKSSRESAVIGPVIFKDRLNRVWGTFCFVFCIGKCCNGKICARMISTYPSRLCVNVLAET